MRVTLAVTAYNAAWCIERALDSVIAQTRPPDDLLVADDGSTDDTVERIERRYGSRVRVLRLPHGGLTASRKASFEAASGDWIASLDADDLWLPVKLERQIAFLEAHPEVRWCTTDGVYESAEAVIRDSWLSDYFKPVSDRAGDLLPELSQRCFPLVSSMLVNRDAYRAVGGFDTSFRYSQDYDLWLRLAARFPGGICAQPLIRYWSSPGQLSRKVEARFLDDLALMQRLGRGELRDTPELRRVGEQRAGALEYELALMCLKEGRASEARERFRRASNSGRASRRLISGLGAALPGSLLGALGAVGWLRGIAASVRRPLSRVDSGAPPGEPA
jgi:hypothetical protein